MFKTVSKWYSNGGMCIIWGTVNSVYKDHPQDLRVEWSNVVSCSLISGSFRMMEETGVPGNTTNCRQGTDKLFHTMTHPESDSNSGSAQF